MYLPSAFREDRLGTLHDLIRNHPLATLITASPGGLIANLVPFILVESGDKGTLRAHVAKANDQVEAIRAGAETLVVFHGPESYITPSWYTSKREHGRVVPTWNYVMVQARGQPRLVEDPDWIRRQVEQLTSSQESRRSEPWKVSDAPDHFVSAQIQAIVGIEIPIRSIEGKWKVSQNRSVEDRRSVRDSLEQEGLNPEMAKLVSPD